MLHHILCSRGWGVNVCHGGDVHLGAWAVMPGSSRSRFHDIRCWDSSTWEERLRRYTTHVTVHEVNGMPVSEAMCCIGRSTVKPCQLLQAGSAVSESTGANGRQSPADFCQRHQAAPHLSTRWSPVTVDGPVTAMVKRAKLRWWLDGVSNRFARYTGAWRARSRRSRKTVLQRAQRELDPRVPRDGIHGIVSR